MYEIFGTISSGSGWEMAKATPCLVNYQQQYEYYQLGNSRVIYPFNDQSTSTMWVTRDIRYDDEYDCIYVWDDGNARRSYNYLIKAIAPAINGGGGGRPSLRRCGSVLSPGYPHCRQRRTYYHGSCRPHDGSGL